MQDFTGKTIGGCRIIKKIGEGGMGVIYEAQQLSLNRPVAVKFLAHHLTHSEKNVSRFLREAKSAASLSHPNILQVVDVGQEENSLYMITELVKGKTLGEIVNEKGVFSEGDALKIISDIASALTAAEEKNMVHRDLKPDNVMITHKGLVKVMDFGLAKNIESATHCITNPGAAIGTPNYMSPEQVKGEPVDIRSDIYSLGLVLFFLVTGQSAYKGDTSVSIFNQQINAPLPDPGSIKPDISKEVKILIKKMCQKNPSNRYQSPGKITQVIALSKNDPAAFAYTVKVEAVKTVFSRLKPSKRLSPVWGISVVSVSLVLLFLFLFPHRQKEKAEDLKANSSLAEMSYKDWMEKGEAYLEKEEWERASAVFKKAMQAYPDETGTQMWISLAIQKRDREILKGIHEEIISPGKLTVLVAEFPPFYFEEANGMRRGFDVDLVKKFAEKMNLSVHYEMVVHYKDLIDELVNNKADIIAAGMTITDLRKEKIQFSYPYLTNTEVLVTKNGRSLKNAQDLREMKIGFVPGTTYEKTVKGIPDVLPSSYNLEEEMVNALISGEIDAYIEDLGSALLTTKRHPDLEIAFTFKDLEHLGVGIRKDTPYLKKAIDFFIRDAEESGLLKDLFEKYFIN